MKVKKLNKRQKGLIERAIRNLNVKSLYDCYKNPSVYKKSAYQNCIDYVASLYGNNYTYCISSHNTNMFSMSFFAFTFDGMNKHYYFILFTAHSTEVFEIPQDEIIEIPTGIKVLL